MADVQAGAEQIDADAKKLARVEPRDHFLNVMKAILKGIPVIGGVLGSLASDYIPTQRAERLTKFTEDVAKELGRVAESLNKDYVLTDEFAFLFQRTHEDVSRDYQHVKLEAYKNILVNALRSKVPASTQEAYLTEPC